MQSFIDPERRYVQMLEIDFTDASNISDQEYKFSGTYLFVESFQAGSNEDVEFVIKFNEMHQDGFPLIDGAEFQIDFYRFFISGGVVRVSSAKTPAIRLVIGYNAVYRRYTTKVSAERFDSVSNGTNFYPGGKLVGIYITSFGDLSFKDNTGAATQTISNIPAGTFLPMSPSYIVGATTTADIQIFYVE